MYLSPILVTDNCWLLYVMWVVSTWVMLCKYLSLRPIDLSNGVPTCQVGPSFHYEKSC